MPQAMTIEQAQAQREREIDGNRALGVQEWENNEPQSEAVYEVIDGYHHVPVAPGSDEQLTLGPGHRFHPTKQQAETGSLKGKARELTETEYRGIHREERKPRSTGADIGIRALPMAEGTMKIALDAGLREEDFRRIEPGHEGRFTRSQVDELIAAREQASG